MDRLGMLVMLDRAWDKTAFTDTVFRMLTQAQVHAQAHTKAQAQVHAQAQA